MKGIYQQTKLYKEKWRESNKDKYNEYQKAYMKRKYIMDKIRKEFFNILLN